MSILSEMIVAAKDKSYKAMVDFHNSEKRTNLRCRCYFKKKTGTQIHLDEDVNLGDLGIHPHP